MFGQFWDSLQALQPRTMQKFFESRIWSTIPVQQKSYWSIEFCHFLNNSPSRRKYNWSHAQLSNCSVCWYSLSGWTPRNEVYRGELFLSCGLESWPRCAALNLHVSYHWGKILAILLVTCSYFRKSLYFTSASSTLYPSCFEFHQVFLELVKLSRFDHLCAVAGICRNSPSSISYSMSSAARRSNFEFFETTSNPIGQLSLWGFCWNSKLQA